MKMGSIVGLALCCILLVTGAIFCTAGYISARNSGQYLFTQTNENGSFFISDVDDTQTSKIRLGVTDAKITVVGGADSSRVEFINYNPNYYVLSTTSKVINFEEMEDFTSMLKVWENGFSFKGLRYLFDFRDYGENDRKREINIYLTDKSSMESIEIDANNAEISFEDTELSGNLSIRCNDGNIRLSRVSCAGTLTISGEKNDIVVEEASASTLLINSDYATVFSKNSIFSEANIDVTDGRIDFYFPTTFDNAKLSIFSSTGGILVNGTPISGAYTIENEDTDIQFKIKTVSGDINVEYPSETENDEN